MISLATTHPQRSFFFNAVDRHGHMLVVLVAAVVCRWVPGSLGCLRRTWRADASDRAGDVCSRKPLAFDEGRRGRGWRVRATVASPHRITAAISSRLSVPPRFFLPPSPLFLNPFFGSLTSGIGKKAGLFFSLNKWMERATLRVRGVRIVSCDSHVRARCFFFLNREVMRPPLRC